MNDLKINEFARMRGLVDTLLKRYRQVRRKCDIKDDEWHSRSIEKLAASFLEGSFTGSSDIWSDAAIMQRI